jgi:hypothetical protein
MVMMSGTIGDVERTGVGVHREFSELEAFSKNFLAPYFLEADARTSMSPLALFNMAYLWRSRSYDLSGLNAPFDCPANHRPVHEISPNIVNCNSTLDINTRIN